MCGHVRALKSLVSLPALLTALIGFTLLVAGPLRPYEATWHRYWARGFPDPVPWVLQQVLDRITGQAVCLPVLLAVAVVIARRRRTWRPLFVVAAAEAAFFGGVGLMKLVLARPAPVMQDARFFAGGLFEDGWHGISYPSGHTSEAILIYGAAVYLIFRYCRPSATVRRRLVIAVGIIAVNSVATAYLLGWHWATDLPAGLLTGGVLLHVVIWVDRHLIARLVPAPGTETDATTTDPPPETNGPPAGTTGTFGAPNTGAAPEGRPVGTSPDSVGPDPGDLEHGELRADPHPQ